MTKRSEEEVLKLKAAQFEAESQEEAISARGHSAVNDLGRTDSRKQGIRSIELKASLYTPKKTRGIIETGQTQIIFDNEDLGGVKISGKTDRTLTYLVSLIPIEAYFNRNDEVVRVETTLSDIKQLYKKKDSKETRDGIDEDLTNLASITIQRKEEDGDLKIGLPIAGDIWGRWRSKIIFSFSPSFIRLLSSSDGFTIQYPPALFSVDFKHNPHAWTIGKKLLNHSNSNLGKPNEYILSVKALLDYVESIPSEEEVEASNRHYTDRIIAPMERDLNALVEIGVLDWWDYCHSRGESLEDDEQDARLNESGEEKPLDYRIAKNLFIIWKPKHEYGRMESIEAREKSHTKKLAARAEADRKEARRRERREREADRRIGEATAEEELNSKDK